MKTKCMLIFVALVLLTIGCVQTEKVTVAPPPPPDPCIMPSGYQMEPSVRTAERTLNACPDKLDAVFLRLVEIGSNSPKPGNSVLIQGMLKNLVSSNKISETYAKNMYRKYFSPKFVSFPDNVKTYQLSKEIEGIKRALRDELALKQIGLVGCSNNKDGYKAAESEYARVVNFMENIVLNEDYLKEN